VRKLNPRLMNSARKWTIEYNEKLDSKPENS